jgi:hypothetical protein
MMNGERERLHRARGRGGVNVTLQRRGSPPTLLAVRAEMPDMMGSNRACSRYSEGAVTLAVLGSHSFLMRNRQMPLSCQRLWHLALGIQRCKPRSNTSALLS